jgi:NADH dehydrogenase
LILGGGFGGMYAALEFERALAWGADLDVTLVNRDNFFLFTPMLHEVAASDLDITNIVSPVRKLLRRVTFFHGDIESIDLANKRVGLSHGHEEHCHSLPYDHLVLALGSTTNFFNLPGLADRALTMKSLDDAIVLRNRLIANLEEADFECCAPLRAPLLNFVVAGGGFAGVETIAGMNDFLREAALTIHFIACFAFVGFIVIHVAQVILTGFFNNIRSMVTGWFVVKHEA